MKINLIGVKEQAILTLVLTITSIFLGIILQEKGFVLLIKGQAQLTKNSFTSEKCDAALSFFGIGKKTITLGECNAYIYLYQKELEQRKKEYEFPYVYPSQNLA